MKDTLKIITASAFRVYGWLTAAVAIEILAIGMYATAPGLSIIAMLGALTLPGILVVMMLQLKRLSFHKLSLYATSLSVLFLMLAGLSANIILPRYGHIHPLHISAFGPWFSALLVTTLAASALINAKQVYRFKQPTITRSTIGIFVGLALLPVLSALGAYSLNNGGSNSFSMIMFALIAAWATGLVVMQKRISAWVWPWAIFTMGLAILWSNSLRGSFITGHDIQLEYYVFRLTDAAGHWSMANLRDAYNACLSITILPTILKSLSGIDAFAQYKIIYQALFALFATGVFAIAQRYASRSLAFIAGFIFISFPTFLIDMPMLVRQEIAFGYYIILLLVLFDRSLNQVQRRTLFTLLGVGIVLSHYSTTFVTAGILAGTYVFLLPLRKKVHRSISVGVLAVIIGVTVIWTGVYTKTGNNISAQIVKIGQNLPALLHGTTSSETSTYSIVKKVKPSPQALLNDYSLYLRNLALPNLGSQDSFYADASKYPVLAVKEPTMPLTSLGAWMAQHHLSPSTINNTAKTAYALAIQGLIFFGIVVTWLNRKKLNIAPDFLALAPVGVALLVFQAIMPMVEYGLFRMLLQDLVFLALPISWGALQLLKWLRVRSTRVGQSILIGVFSIAFLFLTGFIPQLIGGAVGQLSLNNSGFYYDAYYTSNSDIAMFDWLKLNYQVGYPINSDMFLRMKIMSNTGITTVDGITPSSLSKQSFVVLANENVTQDRVALYYTTAQGELLFYRYPTNFLDDHKNLLYSSGDTKVYH